MRNQEENERFTRVGPGTPMGNLLRRYWHPVGCTELVTTKPQRVKLLGEELVLYRGASGKPVLMQLRCAHRGVALDYGRVEGDSIRCPYHGWLFDRGGQCVAQPVEVDPKLDKTRLKAYRTEEISGLVFAYLGPEPTPVLPIYDVLRMDQGVKQIRNYTIECNWLQAAENIVDTSHFAWLHGYTFPPFSQKQIIGRFEPADYGMDLQLGVEGYPAPEMAPYVFPCTNRFALPIGGPGGPMMQVLLYRVPLDDTSHQHYFLAFIPSGEPVPSGEQAVHAVNIESKYGEYLPLDSDWWGIDLVDQDRMAMEQQGVIADRTKEHLVASDVGIVKLRRMMQAALEAVEKGEDPIGIIRDPAKQNVEFKLSMNALAQDAARLGDADYAVGLFSEKAPASA